MNSRPDYLELDKLSERNPEILKAVRAYMKFKRETLPVIELKKESEKNDS